MSWTDDYSMVLVKIESDQRVGFVKIELNKRGGGFSTATINPQEVRAIIRKYKLNTSGPNNIPQMEEL